MMYTVNYDKIIDHATTPPIIKSLARQVKSKQYFAIPDFFKSLTDGEVQMLMDMAEKCKDEDINALSNLFLIAEMLAHAEGLCSESDEDAARNLNSLIVWIACVSLERKRLARVFYEHMSFGQEFDNLQIAERLEA